MTEELILSTSTIGQYLDCPRRWYMANVLRLKGENNVAAALGSAVHAGAEAMQKGINPLDAMAKTLDEEMPPEPGPDGDDADGHARLMLATYAEKVARTFHPTKTEWSFLTRIMGHLVSGQIDAADERIDEVRDLKTYDGRKQDNGRAKPFRPEKHRLQMSIYSCGYYALTGRWPKRLALDVLNRVGKYKAIEVQPDYVEMMTQVEVVSAGIRAQRYEPSGAQAGKCPICPFRMICEFSTERPA